MKKILFIIIITTQMIFSQSLPVWNGTSVSTSDNLDATTFNPAGIGINRGSLFGLSMTNIQKNADRPLFNITSVSNNFASAIYSDINGDYHYSFALGFPVSEYSTYVGIQYFTERVLRTGLLLRPVNFLSIGYTNDVYLKDELTRNILGIGIRPFESRLTFGSDFSIMTSKNNSATNYNLFTEITPVDGLNLKFNYDIKNEIYNFSTSIDFGHIETIYGQHSDNSALNHVSIQTYTQKRKTFLDFFKRKNEQKNYIEMTLGGIFIEEPTKRPNPFDFNLNIPLIGIDNNNYIQLRKWIEGVDKITADPNIDGLVIYLKNVGGGFGKILEAKNALQRCKDSGKKIIVYATGISNINYYLISLADEIYINKLSGVDLRGLNFEVTFYKELADSLNIKYEVEKISNYKSALDQWTRTSMSDEMKKNMGALLDDIYAEFVETISKNRGWNLEKTQSIIDEGPYTSKEAKKNNLVTKLLYPDEFDNYKKKLNKSKSKFTSFDQYTKNDIYVYDWRPDSNEEKIAIIYAVGGINVGNSVRNGRGPSTVMGNATIAKAIANARADKSIKAIILRIDSGGGSALASDLIWREVENTTHSKDNSKPIIASMSDVAASGGYYIACQADTIVAYPTTITGSIGVISGRLNYSGLLEKIGLNSERMLYGKHAAIYSNKKLWTEDERKKINNQMLEIYGSFLSRVSNGRKGLDSLEVDKVGIGQVWSGKKAQEYKLIDKIGGLRESIEMAAKMAKIDKEKDIAIIEYPKNEKISILKKKTANRKSKTLDINFTGSLQELHTLINRMPNFENDKMQLVTPYIIEIK